MSPLLCMQDYAVNYLFASPFCFFGKQHTQTITLQRGRTHTLMYERDLQVRHIVFTAVRMGPDQLFMTSVVYYVELCFCF